MAHEHDAGRNTHDNFICVTVLELQHHHETRTDASPVCVVVLHSKDRASGKSKNFIEHVRWSLPTGRLEENGYESSVDNDDDVSSGDDADAALDRLDAQVRSVVTSSCAGRRASCARRAKSTLAQVEASRSWSGMLYGTSCAEACAGRTEVAVSTVKHADQLVRFTFCDCASSKTISVLFRVAILLTWGKTGTGSYFSFQN